MLKQVQTGTKLWEADSPWHLVMKWWKRERNNQIWGMRGGLGLFGAVFQNLTAMPCPCRHLCCRPLSRTRSGCGSWKGTDSASLRVSGFWWWVVGRWPEEGQFSRDHFIDFLFAAWAGRAKLARYFLFWDESVVVNKMSQITAIWI